MILGIINFNMELIIIAAVAKNNAIGYKGKLLYEIPEDLKRFKELTWGYPIIMGKSTYKSLPKQPLPGRRNLVLASDPIEDWENLKDCEIYFSKEGILNAVKNSPKAFIIGGGITYSSFLDRADTLELTEIDAYPDNFDTIFPEFSSEDFREVRREQHIQEETGLRYSFVRYERNLPIL
jgi:dihydrofolate reductase